MICPAVCSTHDSGSVDVHLIPTPCDDEVDHMPVSGTRMHPGGLAFVTISSNSEHRASRSSPLELLLALCSEFELIVIVPNPMFAHDQGPLFIFSSYPRIEVSYQQ